MTLERDRPTPDSAPDVLGKMPEWLVQWPMIAFTGWWNAVFDAWHPDRPPHRASPSHDLTVPDPIEREGERNLFA